MLSEDIRDCIGTVDEWADDAAKYERAAMAARALQKCLTYDEDTDAWTFEERDDEDHKLWAALADLPEDALGG